MAQRAVQPIKQVMDSLRYYKSDKAVFKNCRRFIESLENSDNPAAMGVPKKARHGGCFGTHITKSVVVVYRIDYPARRIDLLGMGDHKTVYGRDG